MKYKDFDGPAEELIRRKLKEIEETEHVKVLHAVESGSRAWGFASADSDYDVRFIYVRQKEDYLCLQDRKDFIEWELDETLDINGWDLQKALRHFHKSNAVLYEWLGSPIVYDTTPEWKRVKSSVIHYFSCKAAMYHYFASANKSYLTCLGKEADGISMEEERPMEEKHSMEEEHSMEEKNSMIKYKKYLYILRPLLACRWIEQKACPPPVPFQHLADAVLEESMKPVVEKLLEEKMRMTESQEGKRILKLDAYLAEQLEYYKQKAHSMEDDRKADWEELNQLFLGIVSSLEGLY